MVGIRERVALNIRKIRQSNALSQEELADLCGLHRTYIGSVERSERNITIENLDRIAHALGVNARDLIG
ncbi:helix-turn-helix domain-containing protein [Sagittula sp. SSi028]|uniref:helix-turn-helix domain-containing protein n=1 Tax=Sagittula sp. SSi028 TaxID=3400636 RepID=UPI003AF8F365